MPFKCLGDASRYPNFSGSLQHVIINGQNLLEMEKNKVLSRSENTAEWLKSPVLQHNEVNDFHSKVSF